MFKLNTNRRHRISVTRNLLSMFMILFLVISMMSTIDAGSVEVLNPILNYVSHTHISLLQQDNYEYKLVESGKNVGSSSWQEGNEFSGLTYDTEYDCYQRIKAMNGAPASEISQVLEVRTPELKIDGGYQVMVLKYLSNGNPWFYSGAIDLFIVNQDKEVRKVSGLSIAQFGVFYIPEEMIYEDDLYIYVDTDETANSQLKPITKGVTGVGLIYLQNPSVTGQLLGSNGNSIQNGVIAMYNEIKSEEFGSGEGFITAIETNVNGEYKLAPFLPVDVNKPPLEPGEVRPVEPTVITTAQLVGIAPVEKAISYGQYIVDLDPEASLVTGYDIACDTPIYIEAFGLPTKTVAVEYNEMMNTKMTTEIERYHSEAVANSLEVRMASMPQEPEVVIEDHYLMTLYEPGSGDSDELFSGRVNVYIAGSEICMISDLQIYNGVVAIPKDLVDSSDRVVYFTTENFANTRAIDIIHNNDSVVDLGNVYFQNAVIEGDITNSLGSSDQAYVGVSYAHNGSSQLFMMRADSSNHYKLAPLGDNMGMFEMVGFIAEGLIFSMPSYETMVAHTVNYECFMSYGFGNMEPQQKVIPMEFLDKVQGR